MLWVLLIVVFVAVVLGVIFFLIYRGVKKGTVRFAKHSSTWWKSFLATFLVLDLSRRNKKK